MSREIEVLFNKRETNHVVVNGAERYCVNCVYFEQYYRKNRGNVYGWVGTSSGYCVLREQAKSAMAQPCCKFRREEEKR